MFVIAECDVGLVMGLNVCISMGGLNRLVAVRRKESDVHHDARSTHPCAYCTSKRERVSEDIVLQGKRARTGGLGARCRWGFRARHLALPALTYM